MLISVELSASAGVLRCSYEDCRGVSVAGGVLHVVDPDQTVKAIWLSGDVLAPMSPPRIYGTRVHLDAAIA